MSPPLGHLLLPAQLRPALLLLLVRPSPTLRVHHYVDVIVIISVRLLLSCTSPSLHAPDAHPLVALSPLRHPPLQLVPIYPSCSVPGARACSPFPRFPGSSPRSPPLYLPRHTPRRKPQSTAPPLPLLPPLLPSHHRNLHALRRMRHSRRSTVAASAASPSIIIGRHVETPFAVAAAGYPATPSSTAGRPRTALPCRASTSMAPPSRAPLASLPYQPGALQLPPHPPGLLPNPIPPMDMELDLEEGEIPPRQPR